MTDNKSEKRPAAVMPSKIAPEDAARLKQHKPLIDKALKAMGKYYFDVGQLLTDAKGNMEHGLFCSWVDKNLPFGRRSAQIYMRIAATLPNDQPKLLVLQLKTLKALSSEELSDVLRDEIVGDIEDGKLETDALICKRVADIVLGSEGQEARTRRQAEVKQAQIKAANFVHELAGDQIGDLIDLLRQANMAPLAKMLEDVATSPLAPSHELAL
ncbi:DUF3102 domain-containing protein [Pelagibacterium luteolum]|uniref:DUF3102 domain-containing protein n=1 Tax=Pelagibacterium luteolum TaxID=440168 RepID=A0A1G7XWA7_9HYPH|nr:DUF3102 domain-containing protein [Pelagibacterium luteolum]SDG88478.1 Protein of unknown function [Pelagibacterium luteolum]